METINKYTCRQQAQFLIEAVTPLALGSGVKDVITDALVATDCNDMPYLPGTTIAGIFRSLCASAQEGVEKLDLDALFGWQNNNKGEGSRLFFSDGRILNSKGEVMDGLNQKVYNDPLLSAYLNLPIRQHASLGPSGTTVNTGKFDQQVVFAGTRFMFQIEMISEDTDMTKLLSLIKRLQSMEFRLGSGSRKGYGKIRVLKAGTRCFDLKDVENGLKPYLASSSRLGNRWDGWQIVSLQEPENDEAWTTYTLPVQAKDFFLFGSGMGDLNGDADMTYVTEQKVIGPDDNRKLSDPCVVIPASSVKGAISHRVAFHYNRLNQWFAGNENAKTGEENKAVQLLFGSAKGDITRGNVLFEDILLEEASDIHDKLLNHVAIDSFTGGAMESALFAEKVIFKSNGFNLTMHVRTSVFDEPKVKEAFEATLNDIREGRLALGGGINRGHGVFGSSNR